MNRNTKVWYYLCLLIELSVIKADDESIREIDDICLMEDDLVVDCVVGAIELENYER